jgi:excisionase family DNA binding protein
MSSKIQIQRTCIFCGQVFTALTLLTRYCSHTCNQKHYKEVKRLEKLQANRVTLSAAPGMKENDYTGIQQKCFLSLDETAAILGASRRTIQRLIATGRLKAGKIGTRCIIQRTEIDKLFK